jgi:hypothetical protein
MSWRWGALMLAGCATTPVVPPSTPVTVAPPVVEPQAVSSPALAVARAFTAAVKAGRFDDALALTSARWRSTLDGPRFAADFAREPLSAERVARLDRAITGGQLRGTSTVEVLLEGQPVLVLTPEADSWRVDALK